MADLRLDLDQLRMLGGRLDSISTQFASADALGDDVVAAVGPVGGLRDQAHAFAANWNDTRRRIQANLTSLSESLEMISQTFQDLDAMLATQAEALAPEAMDAR